MMLWAEHVACMGRWYIHISCEA